MSLVDKSKLTKLIVSIIICEVVGSVGAIFTAPNIPTWYATLTKPFFAPPNWVFAPVWTTLFFLMGVSLYLVWMKKDNKIMKQRKIALVLFGVQFAFNVLWSYLFFGLRNPFLGFIGIIILWISIVSTIIYFYKVEKKSAYLLLPYIVWVSVASLLNYSIMLLN